MRNQRRSDPAQRTPGQQVAALAFEQADAGRAGEPHTTSRSPGDSSGVTGGTSSRNRAARRLRRECERDEVVFAGDVARSACPARSEPSATTSSETCRGPSSSLNAPSASPVTAVRASSGAVRPETLSATVFLTAAPSRSMRFWLNIRTTTPGSRVELADEQRGGDVHQVVAGDDDDRRRRP